MSKPLKAHPVMGVFALGGVIRTVQKHLKWFVAGAILFVILMIVLIIGGILLIGNLLLGPAIQQVPQLQQQGTTLFQQGQQMLQQYQGSPQQEQLQQVQEQLNQVQKLLEQGATPAASEGEGETVQGAGQE